MEPNQTKHFQIRPQTASSCASVTEEERTQEKGVNLEITAAVKKLFRLLTSVPLCSLITRTVSDDYVTETHCCRGTFYSVKVQSTCWSGLTKELAGLCQEQMVLDNNVIRTVQCYRPSVWLWCKLLTIWKKPLMQPLLLTQNETRNRTLQPTEIAEKSSPLLRHSEWPQSKCNLHLCKDTTKRHFASSRLWNRSSTEQCALCGKHQICSAKVRSQRQPAVCSFEHRIKEVPHLSVLMHKWICFAWQEKSLAFERTCCFEQQPNAARMHGIVTNIGSSFLVAFFCWLKELNCFLSFSRFPSVSFSPTTCVTTRDASSLKLALQPCRQSDVRQSVPAQRK